MSRIDKAPLGSPSLSSGGGSPGGSRGGFSSFLRARSGSNRAASPDPEETSAMRRGPSSRARSMTIGTPTPDADSGGGGFWRRRGGTESTSLPSTPVANEQPDPLANLSPSTSEAVAAADEPTQSLRLVPHLETASRSLHFEPITRTLRPSRGPIRIGRFNERSERSGEGRADEASESRIAFRSKVVSRAHAEIWADQDGRVLVRDTKSSSGTFLNHIRLGAPGSESRPFTLRDGDVLQLGVDYQGGTENMYRCVKMRVELNRSWQRGANAYNRNTFRQLQALGAASTGPLTRSRSEAQATTLNTAARDPEVQQPKVKAAAFPPRQAKDESNSTTCCICLFSVMVCQALFIAPCSHVLQRQSDDAESRRRYHYKCILPLLRMHHPGFSCPLCRTFADLDADVELEEAWEPEDDQDSEPDAQDGDEATETIAAAIPTSRSGSIVDALDRRPSVASSLLSRPFVDALEDAHHHEFDTRRSSVFVSGADGQATPFPIKGRASSRPASIRSFKQDASSSRPPALRTDQSSAARKPDS